MTIPEFVKQILHPEQYPQGVYIAIVPNSERWQYDLEVEINHGTIGGIYTTDCPTDTKGLRKARKLADELEQILTANNVKVFTNREEWEKVEFVAPDTDRMKDATKKCLEVLAKWEKPTGTATLKPPQ